MGLARRYQELQVLHQYSKPNLINRLHLAHAHHHERHAPLHIYHGPTKVVHGLEASQPADPDRLLLIALLRSRPNPQRQAHLVKAHVVGQPPRYLEAPKACCQEAI